MSPAGRCQRYAKLIAALAPRSVKGGRSFTVLPDGSLVLSMYEQKEADILAIDLP
ncbi:hypothetical protein [Gallaecimonas pentaromativorans]|uniref:hypothetical protein n=1 Tax=Gallaecimonas pentaromativorans TaxID=584787 RepID=UPI001475082E|nr:hypothetical protein [Gallaecimonas pentaromativorans]